MSTSSILSSTISSTISSSANAMVSVPFTHAIMVKLGQDNYMLWRAKFLPYLRSYNLLGYVDGTKSCPAPMVTTTMEEGATQVANLEYLTWYNQDQMVLSGKLSSLTEEILTHVMLMTTSREVWVSLERMFASKSLARVFQTRM